MGVIIETKVENLCFYLQQFKNDVIIKTLIKYCVFLCNKPIFNSYTLIGPYIHSQYIYVGTHEFFSPLTYWF